MEIEEIKSLVWDKLAQFKGADMGQQHNQMRFTFELSNLLQYLHRHGVIIVDENNRHLVFTGITFDQGTAVNMFTNRYQR